MAPAGRRHQAFGPQAPKDRQMSEHHPGNMDIRAQEKTFAGFIKAITWGSVLVALVLIIMALADA
jgi:hypothetical protein